MQGGLLSPNLSSKDRGPSEKSCNILSLLMKVSFGTQNRKKSIFLLCSLWVKILKLNSNFSILGPKKRQKMTEHISHTNINLLTRMKFKNQEKKTAIIGLACSSEMLDKNVAPFSGSHKLIYS